MKKAPDARIYMGLAGLTIVVGLGLLYTENSKVGAESARLAKLRGQQSDAKKVASQLATSNKALTELQEKLKHLEGGVPDVAYMPTMLKEIESTGRQQGIEILGVRPIAKANNDKKKAQKAYDEIDIEIKGRGKYGDVMRFVQSLNRFPKIVATRTVSLQPRPTGPNDRSSVTLLEVQVQLRAYLFRTEKPVVAGAATGVKETT